MSLTGITGIIGFDKEANMQSRFEEYHKKNPQVFDLFEKFAKKIRIVGYKNFGAKAIMERVRWEMIVSTTDNEPFKINNNYTSRYVRLLEEKDSSFEGFFRKRQLRS